MQLKTLEAFKAIIAENIAVHVYSVIYLNADLQHPITLQAPPELDARKTIANWLNVAFELKRQIAKPRSLSVAKTKGSKSTKASKPAVTKTSSVPYSDLIGSNLPNAYGTLLRNALKLSKKDTETVTKLQMRSDLRGRLGFYNLESSYGTQLIFIVYRIDGINKEHLLCALESVGQKLKACEYSEQELRKYTVLIPNLSIISDDVKKDMIQDIITAN